MVFLFFHRRCCMESPSEKLAKRIVERLVEEGLVTSERGKRIQSKLPTGQVQSEDWRAEIELSVSAVKNREKA